MGRFVPEEGTMIDGYWIPGKVTSGFKVLYRIHQNEKELLTDSTLVSDDCFYSPLGCLSLRVQFCRRRVFST